MKRWKQASYLCLPVLALGVSVWAAPHGQSKAAAHKHTPRADKRAEQEPLPSVPAAQSIHNELKNTRAKSTAAGQVSCCITPACDFCIAHLAMCQCRKNLTSHQPVCRECKGGWSAGEGHMAHVNPHSVKVMSAEMVRKAVADTTAKGQKQGWEDTKKPAPPK